MRKIQVQQAIEFVELLEQAHNEIKRSIENKDILAAQSLLIDCQNGAIQLGTLIEKTEGENFKTVNIIEEYCEVIYQFHQKLEQGEDVNLNKTYKTLYRLSIKIANSIKNDIPIRTEVVFLPYKASMWDSFESVWKAANEDELCDAYVIPVPYYDKNPDESFSAEHYEGNLFPKYVPITRYDRYDFECRRPDIIFIHNPYDDRNFVTSIHPYFYSRNLKKFTDLLVYIPYFVHQNDMVKDGYCLMPGVIYADKVILQSERVREQYIRYYLDSLPEILAVLPELKETQGKYTKYEIEQKFQALGSPKLDIDVRTENIIPDEWKTFLGQDKKVIFFNTHLSGLLIGKSEAFLKKLNWVFDFYKNREDAVLLWRPHPLIVETARSMNPEAIAPYLQLVDKYKQQKIGIYDDSSDLHRAVDLADAYYGDKSSVVELFMHQGKPIMIMSHDIQEIKKN